MTVEQVMRRVGRGALVVGNHHRMPGGVAQARVEAERGQLIDEPLAGAAAFRRVSRICGDRLDAQEPEQALKALIEI